MSKSELIEEVANQTGSTKRTSGEAVDAVILAITDSLARGEKVTLAGFGTFQVMERKAKRARNCSTRKKLQITTKKISNFRLGKELRDKVVQNSYRIRR